MPLIVRGICDVNKIVDLDQLAEASNTAPFYFRRVFRDVTGKPLQRLVRHLRLVLAAYRLVYSDRKAIDIATDAGYQSQAAFTRVFRGTFGSAPTAVRCRRPDVPWPDRGPCCRVVNSVHRGPRRLAFLRHFGQDSDSGPVWRQIQQQVDMIGAGVGRSVAAIDIAYDDPAYFLNSKTRHDLCVVVPPGSRLVEGLGVQQLPEATGQAALHSGPPGFVVFTYMHLAVAAALSGEHISSFPPLPYYAEYEDPGAVADGTSTVALVRISPEADRERVE
ncbi:MAG: helix-turn-helix domain-containing protein [Pseudonocardiaceae bacterium]